MSSILCWLEYFIHPVMITFFAYIITFAFSSVYSISYAFASPALGLANAVRTVSGGGVSPHDAVPCCVFFFADPMRYEVYDNCIHCDVNVFRWLCEKRPFIETQRSNAKLKHHRDVKIPADRFLAAYCSSVTKISSNRYYAILNVILNVQFLEKAQSDWGRSLLRSARTAAGLLYGSHAGFMGVGWPSGLGRSHRQVRAVVCAGLWVRVPPPLGHASLPTAGGIGDCCLMWTNGIVHNTGEWIHGGHGRKLTGELTRPKNPNNYN